MGRYSIANNRNNPPQETVPEGQSDIVSFGLDNPDINPMVHVPFHPSREKQRIGLIFTDTRNIFKAVRVHFVEGQGYVKCSGGSCCKAGESSKSLLRVGCPIIVYGKDLRKYEVRPFIFNESLLRKMVGLEKGLTRDFYVSLENPYMSRPQYVLNNLSTVDAAPNSIWRHSRIKTDVLRQAEAIRPGLPRLIAKIWKPPLGATLDEKVSAALDTALKPIPIFKETNLDELLASL